MTMFIEPPPFQLERIVKLFDYDPETGKIKNKVGRGRYGRYGLGKEAGTERNGYIFIKIDNRAVQAHKIAWFIVHNKWPKEIDHKNRNGLDNRITNLEPVTHTENNKRRWERTTCFEERRWKRKWKHQCS